MRACVVCGSSFYASARRPNSMYCSLTCKGIGSRASFHCETCGKRVEHGYRSRSKRWCSRSCAATARRTGSEHPCTVCGKLKYIPSGYTISTHGVFCTLACWNTYQTYSPERIFYGGRWHRQRTAALKRDNHVCQGCGILARRVRGGLHVHHIIPFKLWPDQDSANDLANLLSLCPSCHKRADLAYRQDGTILFPSDQSDA